MSNITCPRAPAQIISHADWQYHPFTLSFRDIEALPASPGIAVSDETIRQCCKKYASNHCKQVKKSRGQLSDTCYLDEAFIKINNVLHYLWRAVDQYGDAINIFVHKRKHKKAAMRFFKRRLKDQEGTRLKIITDKLKSYSAVKKQLIPSAEHATVQYENIRGELSNPPTRHKK